MYLIFDTETTTDASQKLRLGSYQVRKKGELMERGIFYAADALRSDLLKTSLLSLASTLITSPATNSPESID